MKRRAAALAHKMHIDGEETSGAIQDLPLGNKRLPAINPGRVQRVDQARIKP